MKNRSRRWQTTAVDKTKTTDRFENISCRLIVKLKEKSMYASR